MVFNILAEIISVSFFLRLSVSGLMLYSYNEIRLIANAIQNLTIKEIVTKAGWGVFAFAAGRIVAAFIDGLIGYQNGIFTNLLNYLFWFWIIFYLRKTRVRVESNEVGDIGRMKVSEYIDNIIFEIRLEKAAVDLHKSK